jgi:hypothetical protein
MRSENYLNTDNLKPYLQVFLEKLEREAAAAATEAVEDAEITALDAVKIAIYLMPKAKKSSLDDEEGRVTSVKGIDLEKIRKNINQLEKWNDRFVAVIEKGDQMRAMISPTTNENGENVRLKIEGREVEATVLSPEEYEAFVEISKALINDAFDEYIKDQKELEEKQKANKSKSPDRRPISQPKEKKAEIGQSRVEALLYELQKVPEKIKLSFLRRMGEVQREIAQRNKEESIRQHQDKLDRIDAKEDKREIERRVVKTEQKSNHQLKSAYTQEDVLTDHLENNLG